MRQDSNAGEGRRRRRVLAVALTGIMLASATAGVAAIRFHIFPEAAPVADGDLNEMRGGFKLPNMDVTVHFGFKLKTMVDLPDLGDAIQPNFVAVPDGGRQIVANTRVEFDDPRKAVVSTVVKENGQVVDRNSGTTNLKRDQVRLQVGDPGSAAVTRIIDARQVTTLIESSVADATLKTNDSIAITLDGIEGLQEKLPSVGVLRSIQSVQDSLTMR